MQRFKHTGLLWPDGQTARRDVVATAFSSPRRVLLAQTSSKMLGHDPEKCAAVFRKGHAQSKS
jgi:hypothetical protein